MPHRQAAAVSVFLPFSHLTESRPCLERTLEIDMGFWASEEGRPSPVLEQGLPWAWHPALPTG